MNTDWFTGDWAKRWLPPIMVMTVASGAWIGSLLYKHDLAALPPQTVSVLVTKTVPAVPLPAEVVVKTQTQTNTVTLTPRTPPPVTVVREVPRDAPPPVTVVQRAPAQTQTRVVTKIVEAPPSDAMQAKLDKVPMRGQS